MDEAKQTSGLAVWLETRLSEWEKARESHKQKMLDCYRDVMRIPSDDDTAGTGMARSRKAKGLFVGSTRNKVRSARAKINDALFGNGGMPFDTEPADESLAPFADLMEDIITEQLHRGQFRSMITDGVDMLATYGTGFVFGPFVRKETLTSTYADTSAGFVDIKENVFEFDLPYFELANTLDVTPDAEARCIKDALGTFWATWEAPQKVQSWKADKSYKDIDQALLSGTSSDGQKQGSEMAQQLRGDVVWHKDGRIKVARYFGKIPKSELAPEDDTGELIDAVVIMAGGVVVKVDKSPWSKKPVYRSVYESVPNEMNGVGVAENNAPHQKTVNAAFRLFNEGKGMALLGTKAVDRSKFLPSEDFKKYPGKVYQFKPNLSPEEKKAAIMEFTEQDVTGGWLDVIRVSEQFSDDDTGITKYTQGDDSRNLNKTATGISMIMSASSLPIKEVIQHIDSMWIEPIIECLVEWNLKYLDAETVQKLHGDEAAQKWQQIKQFGKASFMTWKATGTASFMAKEVLINKLQTFSAFAMGNPITAQKIDVTELLNQTWNALEVGKESPVLKDEQGDIPPQIKQQMEQMQQQMQQLESALTKAAEEVGKLESKEAIEMRKLQIEEYKAETERMKAMAPAFDPVQVQALVQQTMHDIIMQNMQPPEMPQEPMQPEMMQEQPAEMMNAPQDMPQDMPQPDMTQPPEGGFFTPDPMQP